MDNNLIRKRAEAKADEVFATFDQYTEQPADIQRLARDTFLLGWLHGRTAGHDEALAMLDTALGR